jgi:hypothetical protein
MQSSNFTLRICNLLERGYNSTVHGKADKRSELTTLQMDLDLHKYPGS